MTYELKPCPKPASRVKAKPPRTRLKRSRMKCNGPMKKFNAKRGGHAFPKNVDEDYREWIRALPCILSGKMIAHGQHICWGAVQVCHVKTRGAGGPDRKNCVPMCASAHDQQHVIGIREFEQRWGVSLKTIARQLTEIYEAEKFPCP